MYPVSNILFIISWDNILVNFLYNMNLRKVLDLVTKKGFYRYLYQVSLEIQECSIEIESYAKCYILEVHSRS